MADEVSNPAEDVDADGYYGEDDVEMDELDLSFLDDEDADPERPGGSSRSDQTRK